MCQGSRQLQSEIVACAHVKGSMGRGSERWSSVTYDTHQITYTVNNAQGLDGSLRFKQPCRPPRIKRESRGRQIYLLAALPFHTYPPLPSIVASSVVPHVRYLYSLPFALLALRCQHTPRVPSGSHCCSRRVFSRSIAPP
jgi:hypothetical protein